MDTNDAIDLVVALARDAAAHRAAGPSSRPLTTELFYAHDDAIRAVDCLLRHDWPAAVPTRTEAHGASRS